MDTTIRNLNARLYRQMKARAAARGENIGTLMNAAMRHYLALPTIAKKTGSIMDLPVFDLGPGNERLSEQVDEVLAEMP